jgi:hypothetical protein
LPVEQSGNQQQKNEGDFAPRVKNKTRQQQPRIAPAQTRKEKIDGQDDGQKKEQKNGRTENHVHEC